MADYASILGGNGDQLPPGEVGQDDDAYYRIESADVFIDRFDSAGDTIIDAIGNPDSVRVELGSGTDTVYSGTAGDTIWAGAGDDIVRSDAGDDTVAGASGNDSIESADGDDSVLGGSGADTILAGLGDDSATGGSGADLLRGGAGDDSLYGGSQNDSLYGEEGDDLLSGGSGADLLLGGAGDDTLIGGSGRDVFAFDDGFGQDVINDFGRGDQINLAADLNGTGITQASDLVTNGMVTGGTTAAGVKFTVITIGDDTIRLESVDHTDFIGQIDTWVKVG